MGYAFISYSTKNQSLADSMRQLLHKNNIKSWMAPADIPAGSKYAQVVNQAIKECACVILMLSDAAQNSIWVSKEIERAINYYKVIIPVQLEDLILNDEFELYISNNQVIALRSFDENQKTVQELLEVVRKLTNNDTIQKKDEGYPRKIEEKRRDVETQFLDELKQLYDVMMEYRFAFQIGSQSEINRTTALLMQIVNRIYVLGERYSSIYPDISKRANEVVNQYNLYAQQFTLFANELNRGYGEESNRLAQLAEKDFRNLIKCILDKLNFS